MQMGKGRAPAPTCIRASSRSTVVIFVRRFSAVCGEDEDAVCRTGSHALRLWSFVGWSYVTKFTCERLSE